uniref:Uncharacterized protein n=1 Tax=Anguilla anguilla TaxID=7936 RepID=A0A0E9PEM6_ANGAN
MAGAVMWQGWINAMFSALLKQALAPRLN